MEFSDRKPQTPGRVKLTPVSGQSNIYDMELADGAGVSGHPAGTPLNKSTFDQFKADMLDFMANNPGPQGRQGPQGPVGVSITNKTFLVGTNSENANGWYKLGSVSLGQYIDYHAKILISKTYENTNMPRGMLDVNIRRGYSDWEEIGVSWETFYGENPNYICYYASPSGIVTFYAYIPQQHAHYRIDILCESNRDVYTNLFQPVVEYGGIWQTRYSTNNPNSTGTPKLKTWRFYSWIYTEECKSDKVVSCTKSTHGFSNIYGAMVVPRSEATSVNNLSGYSNITSGTCRYGVTISGTTVYIAFDDGTFEKGFYCLIYGE